ncbi:MAG: hypothetical protein HXX13_14305 [Bacteroidetes bacterium]|nr:hypothetical protein [Bacteroidota bacterium]
MSRLPFLQIHSVFIKNKNAIRVLTLYGAVLVFNNKVSPGLFGSVLASNLKADVDNLPKYILINQVGVMGGVINHSAVLSTLAFN